MAAKVGPDYERAHKLYMLGLSLAKVAPHVGVSAQALHYTFKKKGLTLRGANLKVPEEVLKSG